MRAHQTYLEDGGQGGIKALAAQVLRQQLLSARHQAVLAHLPDKLAPARAQVCLNSV